MENVYYHPETWGLTVVAELSKDPDYDFDITCAWKDKDGVIYWAHDSGCSCPTPFEDYHRPEDLYKLPESIDLLRKIVDDQYGVGDSDRIKFLTAVGA